ncbi:hypothetical protein Dimus_027466 [Dionaea muscipula]
MVDFQFLHQLLVIYLLSLAPRLLRSPLLDLVVVSSHLVAASLLPRTVEGLVCLQSWMNNVVDICNDEVTIDLDHDAANEVELVAELDAIIVDG